MIVAASPGDDLTGWRIQSYRQSGNGSALLSDVPIDLTDPQFSPSTGLVYYTTSITLPPTTPAQRKAISLTDADGNLVELVGWGRDPSFPIQNGPAGGETVSSGDGTFAGPGNSGWFTKPPGGTWNGSNSNAGNGLPGDLEPFVPPCFAAGTLILTPEGERPVEALAPGDRVLTPAGTTPAIRWVGHRRLRLAGGASLPLRPVRIAAHAFGPGRPHRTLRVSPQHRLALADTRAELWFGAPDVLVPAALLVDGARVAIDLDCGEVTYHHLLFDRHEIVLSNGLPSESLHPGDVALRGFGAESRREILALFPGLRTGDLGAWSGARPTLRAHEARLLGAGVREPRGPTASPAAGTGP